MPDVVESNRDVLSISPLSTNYLLETSRWGKFLAIVGLVIIGLLVVAGFFVGSLITKMPQETGMPFPGYLFGLVYILIGALYIAPVWFLFQFSSKMKIAIATTDSEILEAALKNQKSLYKFMGILLIVVFAFYIIVGGIVLATLPMRFM